MGALVVVVSYLSHSGHQPASSRDEVSTCTLRKHLVVFVEGIDGGLDGEVLLQDLGVGTNGGHRDLIRACGHDLLLHY